jgi:hypothetical protein
MYRHRLRRESVDANTRQEAIFAPGLTKGVVFGLKPNKRNHAFIVVMNGQNDGPPSQVITFRMPEGGEQGHLFW